MNKHVAKALSIAACASMVVSMAACGAANKTEKVDGEYLTVNGTPISYDEFRYYYLTTKASLESSLEEGKTLELPELLTAVEDSFKKDYGVRSWIADQGTTLTDEEKQAVLDNTTMMVSMMGGEDGFQQALDSIYCTKDLYNQMGELQSLQQKALNEWFEKNYTDAVVEYFTNTTDYVHVQHVLIAFDDTTEGADHSAEKATAQEVYEKAVAGEDFEALIEEYNEDPGQASDMNGYTFTTGQMVEEFETASFALEENAISEPVETTYGYHIIKRLPIDLEYIRENAVNMAPTEIVEEANSALDSEIQSHVDAVEITKGDKYDTLTVETFADTIPTPTPVPESSSAESSSAAESTSTESSSASESSSTESSSASESSASESSSAAE